MHQSFSYRVSGDKKEKLRRASQLAAQSGYTLTGNETQGSLSGDGTYGRLSVNYSIAGEQITLTLTEMPTVIVLLYDGEIGTILKQLSAFLADP